MVALELKADPGPIGTIAMPQIGVLWTLAQAKHSSLVENVLHVFFSAFQVESDQPRVIFNTWKNEVLVVVEGQARSEPPVVLRQYLPD